MTLRVLDLFSGIGMFSHGLERTGAFETVAFCEQNEFCQKVLAQHWPSVPIHDDVQTMEFTEGAADVVTGGFPCQDLSDAGQRAGLSGERSGLYRELVRAVRLVRPRYAIVENVAALLNRGMGTVLGDLAEIGADAEWDCVPAEIVGAPHERDRVWIVAHPKGIRCGQGGAGRLVDSFTRVRDEARRNAADPYGARLAFGQSIGGNTCEEFQTTQRSVEWSGEQSIWPSEPALLGVDDECPNRVDRVKALGNGLVPRIPELIGYAIAEAEGLI